MSRVEEQLSEVPDGARGRGRRARGAPAWMWFLAVFGIVVFAGGSLLYVTNRFEPVASDEVVADAGPRVDVQAPAEPVEAEPADGMDMPMPGSAPAAPEDRQGGDQVAAGQAVVEVEMVEFGYVPATIDLQTGVPVVLQFTNSGRLAHEAMLGDAHMQEEFGAAGDHDDGAGGDHHGDVMAVMVGPGETRDLEVVIDEPGTWYMACHLPGHYEQGQIATINVN